MMFENLISWKIIVWYTFYFTRLPLGLWRGVSGAERLPLSSSRDTGGY